MEGRERASGETCPLGEALNTMPGFSQAELCALDKVAPAYVQFFLRVAAEQARHVHLHGRVLAEAKDATKGAFQDFGEGVLGFTESLKQRLPHDSGGLCAHIGRVLKEYRLVDTTYKLNAGRIVQQMGLFEKATTECDMLVYYFQRTSQNVMAFLELQKLNQYSQWKTLRQAFDPKKHRAFKTLPIPNPQIVDIATWGVAARGHLILSYESPGIDFGELSVKISDAMRGISAKKDLVDDTDDTDLELVHLPSNDFPLFHCFSTE